MYCEELVSFKPYYCRTKTNAISSVELIHGHNLGTAIKDYIQQYEGLRKDIEIVYPEVPALKLSDNGLGSTIVRFKRH